jgi:hypothetical protein
LLGADFTNKFRAAQLRWSRYLFWLVGMPSWLVIGATIFSSLNGGGLPIWGMLAVGLCALVASAQ